MDAVRFVVSTNEVILNRSSTFMNDPLVNEC